MQGGNLKFRSGMRDAGVPESGDEMPATPAGAASAPSQAPFFRGPKPDPAARQRGLIEALRKRGN